MMLRRNTQTSIAVLLALALVTCVSLIFFSVWTFKSFNSDHAIHVLMMEDFRIPEDWYYWGQNRLGSLLPFIGSMLVAIGVPSLAAAGMVHVVFLGTIALILFKLFEGSAWSIAALVALIFPVFPFWMQISLGHPYLAQMLFGLLFLLLLRSFPKISAIRWLALGILAFLGLWSTELHLGFLLATFLVCLSNARQLKWQDWLPLGIGLIIGAIFLYEAKEHAVDVKQYAQKFASWQQIRESFQAAWTGLVPLFSLASAKWFNSVLLYFLIFLSLGLGIFRFKKQKAFSHLTKILFLAALFSFFMIHFSHWNYIMELPMRYFSSAYIWFMLALVSGYKDMALKVEYSLILGGLLSLSLISASLFFEDNYSTGAEGRIDRMHAEALIIQQLPNNGDQLSVIGSHWNSYLLDALSDKVVAMPHKGAHIRDYRMLGQWSSAHKFLVIGNDWLDSFPEKIQQHGLVLKKRGADHTIGGDIQYAIYYRVD